MRRRSFVLRLADKVKSSLLKQDISAARSFLSEIYKQWKIAPYNPDSLVQKKGLSIYKKMIERDAQVKAIQTLRKDSRLSTGWEIVPASEDDRDQMLAKFIEVSFEMMKGNLEDNLFQILSAMDYGYSITEKNFRLVNMPKFGGLKYIIDNMKTRDPINWGFIDDDHGNLTGLSMQNVLGTESEPIRQLDKFIIFSYNKSFDNWYGNSDLRAIYSNWWSKDVVTKFWNIAIERFANPHYVGKYPEGIERGGQNSFLDMLDNLQAATNVVVPEGYSVEILGGKGSGARGGAYSTDFKVAIDYHNKMITRGLLTPSLMLDEGDKSGSYALGKKQFDIFLLTLKKLGRTIEETIVNEQIIRQLIDLNFAEVKKYPAFKFRSIEETSPEKKSEFMERLITTGIVDPSEPWVREYLEIQPKEEKEGDQVQSTEVHAGEPTIIDVRMKTDQEKRANFSDIRDFFDQNEEKAKTDLGKVIRSEFNGVVSKVKKLDFSKVKTFKDFPEIDLGRTYISGIKKFMLRFYSKGRVDVRSEVRQAKKDGKFSEIRFAALEPSAALEWLDEYADFLAGIDNANLQREAKQILMQGLKEGASNTDIVDNLEDVFSKYIPGTGGEFTPAKLSTLVRTNATLAYNEGRKSEMQDPDVKDAIPAYRYSAILDDRTTDICNALDGRVWNADDPAWDKYTPPNHFNCRSVILPVFEGEEFTISGKSGLPQPAMGFGLTDRVAIPETIIRMMGK